MCPHDPVGTSLGYGDDILQKGDVRPVMWAPRNMPPRPVFEMALLGIRASGNVNSRPPD
jgi:hypothetical protein